MLFWDLTHTQQHAIVSKRNILVVGGSKAVSCTPTMASAVGSSLQPSFEGGARMSEEWLRKERGRKTQHLKHNSRQAVLGLVGWETIGGPRRGSCISSELARSQNSCRVGGDTRLVFTPGVTLTFQLSTSVFIQCGPSQTHLVNI